MKGRCFLWLALRLMKKQKLRTATLFLGGFSASFLLYTFCRMGYYFWSQMYRPSKDFTSYGFGQSVLTALAVVLVAVVFCCSTVLLQSLFALTFELKWRSLNRLWMLGACKRDIVLMVSVELCILFCTAIPLGSGLAAFVAARVGIWIKFPVWICVSIGIWLFGMFFYCGMSQVFHELHSALDSHRNSNLHRNLNSQGALHPHGRWNVLHWHKRIKFRNCKGKGAFVRFMSGRYYAADRNRYRRITLTIAAAIILYVPASYLIHTNIKMNQEGLHEKYGIEYSSIPDNEDALKKSVEECRTLTAEAAGDSLFYVEVPGTVCVASGLLSENLLAVLKEAGWPGGGKFQADCAIYFLEDDCYHAYMKSAFLETPRESPIVLASRYVNRTAFSKDGQVGRIQTALLSEDAQKMLNRGDIHSSDIQIRCGMFTDESNGKANMAAGDFSDGQNVWDNLVPDACTDTLPDGIDAGKAAVILPLSRLWDFCLDMKNISSKIGGSVEVSFQNMYVCGLFADTDKGLFERLQKNAGPFAFGKLRNNRKIYQEWYDSLHEIHLAMLCICGVLFFTAIFHVFAVLLFHCMHRRHGLAVLWSLGQTKQRLAFILILESTHSFVYALMFAIPISGMLCYIIYKLYCNVWDTGFELPYEQMLLAAAVTAFASAAAVAVSFYQIWRQDFLKEIRQIL